MCVSVCEKRDKRQVHGGREKAVVGMELSSSRKKGVEHLLHSANASLLTPHPHAR